MKHILALFICGCGLLQNAFLQENKKHLFPDGSPISGWFSDTSKIELSGFRRRFVVTDYGAVYDSLIVQTDAIQKTINEAAKQGGGVVVIPKGVFLSGALFFKPNTHLYVSEGAVLKGSDDITDYPMMPSRMEGQNLNYFPALVNAYGVNGFTVSGRGTINGNGLKFWKAFWDRRKENPNCTNLEVSRPRLIFIWNCNDVRLQDVRLVNSGFWTSHFYKCSNVKLIDLYIFSPVEPVKAPSTDAVDIDACSNFLIKGCYMSVNDDAIALKGGKGPWADRDTSNGLNKNIIIENCEFGFCHSALTFGSESVHDRNVLMRNCTVEGAMKLLWLKLRPDTPHKYEFITIENVKGMVCSFIYAKPWKQFFDLKGRKDLLLSLCESITLRNISLKCDVFFDVEITENDHLSNFTFENISIDAVNSSFNKNSIQGLTLKGVKVNNLAIE
jgi:polygalacturonase